MLKQLPEKILLFTACAVLTVPAFAESIFRWVDENGVPHYSDIPRDDAEEIEVQPVQTFKSQGVVSARTPADDSANTDDSEETQATSYQSIAISSPSTEETFWNTGGKLNVAVSLRPGLQMGHRIRVFLDGQFRSDLPEGTSSLMLEDMTRGSHQVFAEVRNENDQVLMRSPPVTFFVQQTDVDNNPRVRPQPPVVTPLEGQSRSQQPPASRRKTVR